MVSLKIEIDDIGVVTLTKEVKTFVLQNVNISLENGVEQNFDKMADERDGYVHWRHDGNHTISLSGTWNDRKDIVQA